MTLSSKQTDNLSSNRTNAKKLMVIGSTCVDVIIKLDHLPVTGEDLHPEYQKFQMGGCAYNVARIPKALDLPVTFVTPVGMEGVFGQFVWRNLEKEQFRGPVRVADAENGCCYCFVERDGERTFVSAHGVEYSFAPDYVEAYREEVFDYTYICGLEVEEPTGAVLIDTLSELHTGTIVYAPGPRGIKVDPERTKKLFALHPILHLNESEALEMACRFGAGQENLTVRTAAQQLQKWTHNLVVITLGGEGVCWLDPESADCGPASISADTPADICAGSAAEPENRFHHQASEPVQVVDTIGAGDSHAGALLSAFAMGMGIVDAMKFANRVSGRVVATEGASIESAVVRELLQV